MHLKLLRRPELTCVPGDLTAGLLTLATLEVSYCVPVGLYHLEPHNTPAHPNTYALVNEGLHVYHWPHSQGRSAILIHAGNTVRDSRGCILVGREHGFLDGEPAVLNSRNALDALLALLHASNESHTLEIR